MAITPLKKIADKKSIMTRKISNFSMFESNSIAKICLK